MIEIDLLRSGVKVCSLPITDSNATYTKRLMAEENIVIEYSTVEEMPIKALDYILYKGVKYTLWATPIPKIGDGDVANYTLVFFAPYYILYNKKLKHIGADGNLTDAFSYSGYTASFAQLIINTINDIDAGWSIGEVENLGFRTVVFNDNSCYTALSKICEAYKCEFDFNDKILTIKEKIGNKTDHTFSYGKGKGLYELTVQELGNASIITRLEVFGGTTNVDKGKRLKLAAPLEKNIDKYGVREDKVVFEHIFPRLKDKTITGVTVPSDIPNAKKWEINLDITFDLSKLVIGGLTPQLQFQSGELMGITFDLAAVSENNTNIDWNNSTKRCYIIVKTDGEYKSPSESRQPKIGDKFVLLNVAMDQSYADDALAELDAEGKKYLDTVCVPQLAYSLGIDPRYIKTHSASINIGDKITVLDTKRDVNDNVRVTIKKYPLSNPNDLDLTISSEVLYESNEKVQVQLDSNSQITAIHDDDIRMQYIELNRIDKEATRIKNSLGPVLDRLSYNDKNDTLTSSVAFASAASVVMFGTEGGTEGGGDSGTLDHGLLFNRDLADQHPMLAITGLSEALSGKASSIHTHNYLSSISKAMIEEVLIGDISTHDHSKYALLNGSSSEDFKVKDLNASGIGYFESGVVMFGTDGGTGGGGSGTLYHDLLENRNMADQHSISAISNLQSILDGKIGNAEIYPWAKSATKPTYTAAEVGALPLTGGSLTGMLYQTTPDGSKHVLYRDSIGVYLENYNTLGVSTCQLRLWNNGRATIAYPDTGNNFYDIWTSRYFNISSHQSGSEMPVKTGFSSATGYLKNPPSAGWYNYITNTSYDLTGGSWAMQIANTFGGGINANYKIYFRQQSAATDISLAPWIEFWTSNNFNPDTKLTINDSWSISNDSISKSEIFFDYSFAGTGKAGSVISGSGLSGRYATQFFGNYLNGNNFYVRTHNGDNNSWNSIRELYHTGNFNPNATVRAANQLETFVGDDFTSGGHFIKATRSPDNWNARLWMCYDKGISQANSVWVYGSDISVRANGANALWATEPQYKDVYRASLSYDGVNRWIFKVNPASPPDIQVSYALYADELYTPNRGNGWLKIGTSNGLLTGVPGYHPALKASTAVYFDCGGVYCGSIIYPLRKGAFRIADAGNVGIELTHNNSTPATVYCGTVQAAGTVVMYSTT